MLTDLISIITPAYNTGAYCHRLLDSVIGQTYPKVEMIVVDDGSTDKTAAVIKSYIQKFENKGYSLMYIYQENGGQSVAIQNALKHIKGEYLIWPDSDDFFDDSTMLESMVNCFKNNLNDVGIVRVGQREIRQDSGEVINTQPEMFGNIDKSNLFEDCLLLKNGFYFGAGAYMAKISALENSTKFPIYTSHDTGQNWQLLLPLFYNYKCITIPKYMYCIVNRANSHSRNKTNYEEKVTRTYLYQDTIISTLHRIKSISNDDLDFYTRSVELKYAMLRFELACFSNKRKDLQKEYRRLKSLRGLNAKIRIKRLLISLHMPWLLKLIQQVL